jgi:periplasmic protein TonB
MFDNYVVSKARRSRKWVGITVTVSVALHVLAVTVLMVRSFWVIEKLPTPDTQATLGAPPPPPPPPPPAGKQQQQQTEKKVRKVRETVQPTRDKQVEPDDSSDDSPDQGEAGGVEGGQVGGVVGGVLGGVEGGVLGGVGDAPPPPPRAQEPQIVPQVALEQQRIAGEKNILPPDEVRLQLRRDGKDRVVAVVKMCLNASGNVSDLKLLKSSGYDAYDRKIRSTMQGWRYRPFMVNSKAVPVCTSVTFIYTQSN